MTVKFWIPGPLRSMTGGRSHVDVETSGGKLQDALEALFAAQPAIRGSHSDGARGNPRAR
jgi:hypothetical protein